MPIRRVQRYLRPGLKGDNWQVQELPLAFGRYETNFRWKQPGDGAQPAVWTATLPKDGDYDVAYYFVPSQFSRRFGLNLAESFSLAVAHGGEVDTLALKSEALTGGWNLLGRFHSVRAAVLQGAQDRMRPILMTTATTILALAPMAVGLGEGAGLRAPMAIAVIGGLVSSTMMALVVIPVAYETVERLR